VDATGVPADITYPTDLKLLNEVREIIDLMQACRATPTKKPWNVILFDNLGFDSNLVYPSNGLNVVCDLKKSHKRKSKVILLNDGLSFAYRKATRVGLTSQRRHLQMFLYLQEEHGTAVIEYSLFISLILIIVAGALHVLGPNLVDVFSFISAEITPVLAI
ncbi:MAG: hypothetical protein WD425_12910, partial [Nitrospirales bacterium]